MKKQKGSYFARDLGRKVGKKRTFRPREVSRRGGSEHVQPPYLLKISSFQCWRCQKISFSSDSRVYSRLYLN